MTELAERDGVNLAYDTAGSGGPGSVFVHGWSCGHFNQLEVPGQVNLMIERLLAIDDAS